MSNAYVLPKTTLGLPGGLTLTQFIQTVLVGLSGLPGNFVRPRWQIEPPKQPDVNVNWMGFGIDVNTPDANAYVWTARDNASLYSQRMEALDIGCTIYGPEALEIYELLRDGFQITNNLAALTNAKMGFVEVTTARKVPELFDGRFYNRVQASVILRREVQRIYAVPTLLSASGTVYTDTFVNDVQYSLDWNSQNEET